MKKRVFFILVCLVLSITPVFADGATAATNATAIDTLWTLLAACMVFFMQAGFAMVETGFTRSKNAGNIIMKNLMDFSVGSIAFWAVGFGLMFGTSKFGFIGGDGFFMTEATRASGEGQWTFVFWLFQCVFAATAATIVSGAMAERTKFSSYMVYSFFITALIYPIVGKWAWGGLNGAESAGWLESLGFMDFAGSTVVHSVGGWAALMGAIILGPRTGKYVRVKDKTIVKAIPGHNIPMAALGVFILWFGWFGFNAGSTTAGTNLDIAFIAVNTSLAASAGAIAAMVISWISYGKPDPSMSMNGALAGLVGITAGCAFVSPLSAIIIGLLAGIIVVLAVDFIDKVLHIDDPVGAISVHGICGAFGTLMVGLFAEEAYSGGIKGLFFDGGFDLLGVQALGVVAVAAWVLGTTFVLFNVIKATIGLRVSPQEEIKGLDIEEHGMESYSGFQIFKSY